MSLGNTVATKMTAAGQVTTAPAVLRGIVYNDTSGGSAGAVKMTNGNGGDLQFDVDTPGNGVAIYVGPDLNIPFPGGIYVSELTNVDAVTVFWSRS